MDIGRAFSFVFQDPRWVTKVLIGALMVVIPVFGWFTLAGYAARILRQVATSGTDLPLPEWDSLGDLFVAGFKVAAATFVWGLPVSLLGFALGGLAESGGSAALANCLTLPLGLVVAFVSPAVAARVAVTGSFGEGLQVGQIFALVRRNPADYLIVAVMSFVASLVAVFGLLLFCVGVLATLFYAYLVIFHLYGQAYWRSTAGTATPPGQPAPRF